MGKGADLWGQVPCSVRLSGLRYSVVSFEVVETREAPPIARFMRSPQGPQLQRHIKVAWKNSKLIDMGCSRTGQSRRVAMREVMLWSSWWALLDISFPLFAPIQIMLPCLVWAFALLSITLASPVLVSPQDNTDDYYCGRQTYGSPNLVDCHPLLESFAFHLDNSLRVFDEEQMRADQKGSWPGVVGIVGAAHLDRVVQVPRFYSLSMYDRPKIRTGEGME